MLMIHDGMKASAAAMRVGMKARRSSAASLSAISA
jgi:hypothetical protein